MPRVFQEFEAPRYQDNRHMKELRLSALRTGRLYPPEILLVTLYLVLIMMEVVFLNARVEFNYSEWSRSAPQITNTHLPTKLRVT